MSYRTGFLIRTAAALLDLIAMVPVCVLATVVMVSLWDRVGRERAEWIASVLLYALWVGYSTLEIWTAGTPGKLILRMRISSVDGSPADGWQRFLRWSTKQLPIISALLWLLTGFVPLYTLSGFSGLIVTIGCIAAINDDHLAWHDQWSRTAVFRRAKERPATISPPPPAPPPAVDTPRPLA
jgi:uncharacterized RDD family membrane protein YckC